jgi:hypothetical protein
MDYVKRGVLTEIHIADIHFGCNVSPEVEYNILKEQFIIPISNINKIDIISIDGDLFDRKVMANSEVVRYALQFVNDLVDICRYKKSTLLILSGTLSHDANQIKLFYHYLDDPSIDIRIVETIRFEYIHGAKVLCIPELYSVEESVYRHFFFESGYYDEAFIHGTCQGAVYGDNVGTGRLLKPEDFIYCRGMAISGHVHKPGCFFGFYYYTGSPLRYKFNEEEDKGYLIVLHDLDTHIYHVEFEEIKSFRYDTIYLDQLVSEDPKAIIDYINNLKQTQGIDFIKVRFRVPIAGYNKTIINNYYRNINNVAIEYLDSEELDQQKRDEITQNNIKYSYLLDPSISDFERFVIYVNESEGQEFITVDKLTTMLSEVI